MSLLQKVPVSICRILLKWKHTKVHLRRLSITPCYSLELCTQLRISFPFSFASLLFLVICKVFSNSYFAFLHFFFFGMVVVTTSFTMLWIIWRRGWQRMRRLGGITDSMDMSLSRPRDIVEEGRETWRALAHGVAKSQTRFSDWIKPILKLCASSSNGPAPCS